MYTAILFTVTCLAGYSLALLKGPFWGILSYAIIYFNVPDPRINWWANFIPDLRWSYFSSIILTISMILHRKSLSKHKITIIYLIFGFYLLSLATTYTIAVSPEISKRYLYMLLTFSITTFFIIKIISDFEKFKTFMLFIIALSANLSVKAFLYGKRIHARLEGIGPADASGSNEFGILLAAVLPLMLPYIIRGKWYERCLCIMAMPFILNAFILCNSRGAFLALFIGLIYGTLFIADKKVKKYLIISAVCAVPLTIYLADTYFIDRIYNLIQSDTSTEESLNEVSSGRIEIWKYGLRMVKDHPLGAGPNGFKELARYYMPEEMLSYNPGAPYGVRSSHNSYLQVLVEQGFLGLGIYLSICIYVAYRLFKCSKLMKETDNHFLFHKISLISLNISFMVSLMGNMVGAQVYYEFFWWQVGLAVVLCSIIENMAKSKFGKDNEV